MLKFSWTMKYEYAYVHFNSSKKCISSLKSLRSVQISNLEPKNYPEVLRFDWYCEKNLGMLATKSFFSVRFGVAALPSLLSYR